MDWLQDVILIAKLVLEKVMYAHLAIPILDLLEMDA